MAEIAPPPYVGANVADHVDIKVTSTETQKVQQLSAEAKTAATSILEDPSNRQLIKDSIDTLCTQTLEARKAFEDISVLLDTFDARKFKTKEDKDIEPLRPAWETLRARYNALLDKSKSDAVSIKAICDDYKVNVLSLLTEDLSLRMKDVKDEIRGFQARTEKAAKAAKGNSDSFDALRVDVKLCKARIEAAFGDASADPTGRGPILQTEIKDLQQKIGEAQKYIDDCMLALKAAGVVTGVGGVLCAFCPLAAILVAGAAFAAAGAKIAANKKQKELDGGDIDLHCLQHLTSRPCVGYKASLTIKQKELAAIAEREKILENLRTQLQNDTSNFTTIMNQLTALSTFWKAASLLSLPPEMIFLTFVQTPQTSADLTSLTIHLETAYSDDTTMRTFKKTLGDGLAGHIYLTLSEVLGKYISQMSMLEPTK
ncbi:hypothetical protein DFH07DRAFT_775801 [Mycena maculata]|uniref:Uncharacterized protein n=1 Tax=Mycena maculata TaxID=230809 RepID=A0AAD7IQ80_9AGAR|nr:hypothetical protein DFH07DRAFT_775801 [Mycena maculata]